MPSPTSKIPLEIQIKAVCSRRLIDAHDLINPYIPELRELDPRIGSLDSYQQQAREYFTFTAIDPINYFKVHPAVCKSLLLDSYDKRYMPTAFIEEWGYKKFRVGWVTRAGNPLITDIHVFRSFAEATADYVLFSWGCLRLTKEQASWYEMDHY
jgi:hypothetical protein